MSQLEITKIKAELEAYLAQCLEKENPQMPLLMEAMRYSVLGGGKLLRGILCITVARTLGGNDSNIFPTAAAVELIHSYSLVHDDLPSMDDDDYRRGKLSTHKKYGEALAILAGDALLTQAFWLISSKTEDKDLVAGLVEALSLGAGIEGMVIGQVADIANEHKELSLEMLNFIHSHKTGALIAAACQCGAIAAKTSKENITNAKLYGQKIGLAFQIMDDVLDVVSTKENMGKKIGKDQEMGKMTYPRLWGVDKSKEEAKKLFMEAHQIVETFPNNKLLLFLTSHIEGRKN